ncbi:MAG: hypothetical protein RLN83_05020 [Balneola sp.]|tara:strand:- start:423766 stop:424113 length:348 start_codon:yes stop_codon:yes gene_type:complete
MKNLKKFSGELGFDFEVSQQDWGIENADPKRVVEFISYYESFEKLTEKESGDLAQLIFQSAEEHLQENYDEAVRTKVLNFIQAHNSEFPLEFGYWKSLDPKVWTISSLINESKNV